MGRWQKIVLIITGMLLAVGSISAQGASTTVPKYDKAAEALYKATVVEVRDRQCPMSGGMGSHLVVKLSDGNTIEVHLSATKFVKQYELTFKPGEALEITGVKVKFEDVDTIFARKIKRGTDEFLFRDNDGKPLW